MENSINFLDAVWFNFGRGEKIVNGKLTDVNHIDEVWVRHTYDSNEKPQTVSYFKKRCKVNDESTPLPWYNQYPIPIKQEKANDLAELVESSEYRGFHSNLPTTDEPDIHEACD